MKMKLDTVYKAPGTAGTQHVVSGQEMAALTVFTVPGTWYHVHIAVKVCSAKVDIHKTAANSEQQPWQLDTPGFHYYRF